MCEQALTVFSQNAFDGIQMVGSSLICQPLRVRVEHDDPLPQFGQQEADGEMLALTKGYGWVGHSLLRSGVFVRTIAKAARESITGGEGAA